MKSSEPVRRADVFVTDITQEDQVQQVESQVSAKSGKSNTGQQCRHQSSQEHHGFHARGMARRAGYESDQRVSDVPRFRAAYEGYGIRTHHQYDLDHGACLDAAADGLLFDEGGVLGLTKALALELAPDGITVNGISPGPFATEMNTPILQNPELNAQFISKIPVGALGKVEEIGALAAFLCSEEAGFITGTDILIDGGWCAM